jgi:acetyltransferase-like isoleucine patch superfamily enzyme
MAAEPRRIEHDWFPGVVPPNVVSGDDVYIDSSYAFHGFHSRVPDALVLGDATMVYDRATIVTGENARLRVGSYVHLNGCYLYCHELMEIGDFTGLGWGTVVSDTWIGPHTPLDARRALLRAASRDPLRRMPALSESRPVLIGDSVWIGFEVTILPGVTIGRGAIIGCRTTIATDIPPYSLVVGDPARIVGRVEPDDSEEARRRAIAQYARGTGCNLRSLDADREARGSSA